MHSHHKNTTKDKFHFVDQSQIAILTLFYLWKRHCHDWKQVCFKKMKVTLLMSVSFQLNIVAPLRVYFLILSYYICFKVYQDIFLKNWPYHHCTFANLMYWLHPVNWYQKYIHICSLYLCSCLSEHVANALARPIIPFCSHAFEIYCDWSC